MTRWLPTVDQLVHGLFGGAGVALAVGNHATGVVMIAAAVLIAEVKRWRRE